MVSFPLVDGILINRNLRGTRTLGSIIGFYLVYGWEWVFWRDAHEYFMSPFAMFMWVSSMICDSIYPYVLWRVRKTERSLPDGRKTRAYDMWSESQKRL